jgi:phosphoglycerol transferase
MDNMLVEDVPYEERGVYNCFINPTLSGSAPNTFSRDCSAMDLFPTVLSGLGFDIPGHRLGLGPDLFSDLPTLSEEIGPAEYEEQLCRYSQFLTDIFAYKLD